MKRDADLRSSKLPFALLAPALATVLLALVGAGCGLFKAGSASFASVIIKGHSPEEIKSVTAQVFKEDGYAGGSMKGRPMVFQKEASRATTMSREGLADTFYGAQAIDRVVVEIVALGGGQQRLQCQAYVVTGRSDPFFKTKCRSPTSVADRTGRCLTRSRSNSTEPNERRLQRADLVLPPDKPARAGHPDGPDARSVT